MYCAPDESFSAKSDLFSVGVTIGRWMLGPTGSDLAPTTLEKWNHLVSHLTCSVDDRWDASQVLSWLQHMDENVEQSRADSPVKGNEELTPE